MTSLPSFRALNISLKVVSLWRGQDVEVNAVIAKHDSY